MKRANLAIFALTFPLAATVNMVPQIYLQDHADKELLLSGILVTGTIAALGGVLLARRMPPGAWLTRLGIVGTFAALATQLLGPALPLFAALNVAVRMAASGLLHHIDDHLHRASSDTQSNDKLNTIARLTGLLVAPMWFAMVSETSWTLALVGGLTLLTLLPIHGLFQVAPRAQSKVQTEPLRPQDRWVLSSALLYQMALFLFGVDLIYLLGEHIGLERATMAGGLSIVAIHVAAAVATMVPMPGRTVHRLVCSPVVSAAVIGVLLLKLVGSLLSVLLVAALAGVAYGFFVFTVRQYATTGDAAREDGALLAATNNIPNFSALGGFILLGVLAVAADLIGVNVHLLVLGSTMFICLSAVVPAVLAFRPR